MGCWRTALRSLVSIVPLAASLVAIFPSTASAKGVLGTGVGWCAHAENGGYALENHYVSTIGGRVYACGPVPFDGDDSGPAVPPFWPTDDEGGFQCTELAIRYLYAVTDGSDYVRLDSEHYWDGTGKHFVSQVAPHFGFASIGEHRNGHASTELPKKGDIISEMTSPGETSPAASSLGKEYGDVGIVVNANSQTITILAQNNNGSGLNTIYEESSTSWYINSSYSGVHYTSFQWFSPTSSSGVVASPPVRPVLGLPSPPTDPVAMPSSVYSYTIYGTSSLKEYSTPTTSGTLRGTLPEGQSVDVTCQ